MTTTRDATAIPARTFIVTYRFDGDWQTIDGDVPDTADAVMPAILAALHEREGYRPLGKYAIRIWQLDDDIPPQDVTADILGTWLYREYWANESDHDPLPGLDMAIKDEAREAVWPDTDASDWNYENALAADEAFA
jgi:hypothetical protein